MSYQPTSRGVRATCVGICLAVGLLRWLPAAEAHGTVGNRVFIEPLFTEDANVKNELVLPMMGFLVQPGGTWRTVEFSFEKALYPHRLSVELHDGGIDQHSGGRSIAGWDNLELGLKWQAWTSAKHEFVLSPALFIILPTSSANVTPQQTALRPMLLYGKGLGDTRVTWLRPFAIQGDVGFQSSTSGPRDRQLVYDGVLIYSIPYLNHSVRQADDHYLLEDSLRRGFSRGAFFGNLFPYVEVNTSSSVSGSPGGTVSRLRPGILWMGKYAEVSLAVDIPLRAPGLGPRHAGAVVLVDWFLNEILPSFDWTPLGRRARAH